MAKQPVQRVSNYHIEYGQVTHQHWSWNSQKYAGGDNLMTALDAGWKIDKCSVEKHWHDEARAITVYHFALSRNGVQIKMPVIHNPYIERFVTEQNLLSVASSAESDVA